MHFSKYGVKRASSCESCEFYDYDEITDTYGCSLSRDEDEREKFLARRTNGCRYYRFYDEYKSTERQI